MGGRIPKSAQRAIDKANRMRSATLGMQMAERRAMPAPRRMALNETPRSLMNQYDVYFNDELQMLCVVADVDKGMIGRWKSGRGNRPDKNSGLEELYGKVEIRPKAA